jgi:hypothetical protein
MKTFEPYALGPKLAIIKDLLRKFPVGGGDRAGMEFGEGSDYCNRYNKMRMLQNCNKEYWGYTEHQVHRLDLMNSDQVETFILANFYDMRNSYELSRGERGGLSRKTNRVWDRIEKIASRRRNGLLPGVYEIKCGGYYDAAILGYVLSDNGDHAIQLGTTLFSAWAGDRELKALYISFPAVESLQQKASSLQTNLEKKLTKEREQHAVKIAAIENEIQSGQMAMLIAMDMIEAANAA